MKASEFIVHLQQMIKEHGDLPLALLEADCYTNKYNFICADIDIVYTLEDGEYLFDEDDKLTDERKVFLIDWGIVMSDIFVGIHRAEIFQNFLLQDCFKWDFGRPADVERVKQWEDIFITAYDDVINKRIGGDNCDSYIKCREYICKNW